MSLFYVIGLSFDKMHFTCIWVDLGCVLILQQTMFQDQVLKTCKSVQDSS